MAEKAPSKTRMVTGKVRLSYAHLFEPFSASDGQAAKYSVTILIPKSDKSTLAKIAACQKAAIEEQKGKVFGGRVPATLKYTLHDGDEEADLERNPEYADHMYMSLSSNTRPGVVDAQLNAIIDTTEVYSGCYARVSINAFCYNTQGNKGVSFGLNNVQKLADGESLGGRTRAEDDFDVVEDEETDSVL